MMLPKTGDAEWSGDYDGDFSSQITEEFFSTDSMDDYFPDFNFQENTVPLGNAKPFCMHYDWSTKANRKVIDKYYTVQDMPMCQLAHNPKFRWQEGDPKDGIDFSLWKQHSKKGASKDDCDSDAIFVKSKTAQGGVCYTYEVIESICIALTFKVDEETSSYGWSYHGGCFEDGRIANYMSAKPGNDYTFDKLDFEVREYSNVELDSMFSFTNLFWILSILCLIGAMVAGGVLIYQFVEGRKAENNAANSNNGQ